MGLVGYLPVGYLGDEHEEEAEGDEDDQLVVLVLFGQEGAHLVVWRDLLIVGGLVEGSVAKAGTLVGWRCGLGLATYDVLVELSSDVFAQVLEHGGLGQLGQQANDEDEEGRGGEEGGLERATQVVRAGLTRRQG